jgi:hypothetical protein
MGLNSIPTTQCGHRMVNVESVRVSIGLPSCVHAWKRHAHYHMPSFRIPLKTSSATIPLPYGTRLPAPTFRQVCQYIGSPRQTGESSLLRIRKNCPRSFPPSTSAEAQHADGPFARPGRAAPAKVKIGRGRGGGSLPSVYTAPCDH